MELATRASEQREHPAAVSASPSMPSTVPPLRMPFGYAQSLRVARNLGAAWGDDWGRQHRAGLDLRHLPASIGPKLIPPPSGVALKLELRLMHSLQDARTGADVLATQHWAAQGQARVWLDELAAYTRRVGVVKAAPAARDLLQALGANAIASYFAKDVYGRPRPFVVDPTLKPSVDLPSSKSYPSGHTSSAFAAATVLAHYEPERAEELWRTAEQVAVSRVWGGVHFPSDTVAGAFLGAAVGAAILARHA